MQESQVRLVDKPSQPWVTSLHRDRGINTVLVLGGSGDYLDVADLVIRMGDYVPTDVTRRAREVAGEFVAGQTEPVSLRKGVLTLKVLQPSMRFHIEQSRAQILARLQQALGKQKIREVRLTIG